MTLFDTADVYGDGRSERLLGRKIGVFKVDRGLIQEVWFYTAEDPDAVAEFMRG